MLWLLLLAIAWFGYWLLEDFLVHFAPTLPAKIVVKTLTTIGFLTIIVVGGYKVTHHFESAFSNGYNLPSFLPSRIHLFIALALCVYGRVIGLGSQKFMDGELKRAPWMLVVFGALPPLFGVAATVFHSQMPQAIGLIFGYVLDDIWSVYLISLILLLPYLLTISKEFKKRM